MTTLENAREQLLSQIEMELCRIYPAGSKAPEKLEELYDMISELPLSNFIFNWYRVNADKVLIRYIGKEVCIYKADDDDDLPSGYIVGNDDHDALDDLIDQALGNES